MPQLIDELKSVKLFGVSGHRITPLTKNHVLIESADGAEAHVYDVRKIEGLNLKTLKLKEELAEKRGLTKKLASQTLLEHKPVLLAWTSIDEVPLNAWFQYPECGTTAHRIIGCDNHTIELSPWGWFTFENMLKQLTYSHDLKAWHPCGKEVAK